MMTQRLASAKKETSDLVLRTNKLTLERDKLQLKQSVLDAFLGEYQLSREQHDLLTGAGHALHQHQHQQMGVAFFEALQRVQEIHANCKRLLRTRQQKAGLDIMEQMAAIQETAYERLYRWTQGPLESYLLFFFVILRFDGLCCVSSFKHVLQVCCMCMLTQSRGVSWADNRNDRPHAPSEPRI